MLTDAEPPRLLLIDDDELSREILELLLSAAGYDVMATSSGEEALALMRSGLGVEIILSDLKMPGLAGAELAAAFRALGAPRALLAMSASQPAHGAVAGYDAFLLKPFRMEEFGEAVRSVAGGGLAIAAAAEGESAGAGVLDETKLLKLQGSFKPEQLDELFRFALTDADRQLELMQVAAAAGDDGLYRRCAHSMKGSFGMLGAPELQLLAAEAEIGGLEDPTTQVTKRKLFSSALSKLRHTLVSRGICHD